MGCCKTFCSAIVVALLAMFAHQMYTVVGMPAWWWEARLPDTVEALDITDTARLKHVFFSGEPWLLQCYSGLPYAGQHLPAPFRLNPTFVESVKSMSSLVKGGTLDCEAKLPNNPNKTLVSKFGLVRRTQPLLLYAGGGDRPKQVPAASASSVYGVTAWVKPKAEPKVRVARSQKAVLAYCAGRRACLLTKLPADSVVLEQLARKYRTVEVVTIGTDGTLSWGRGEEVGETLEPEEAVHFGQPISLLRADPEAPRPTRKGARPAPRLLRGYDGADDFPSLSRFLEKGLEATADGGGFVRSELPNVKVPDKPKRQPKAASSGGASTNDNAERQAKRAKARAETRKKEEAAAAERLTQAKAKNAEQRRDAERRRREEMADEESAAANILEEAGEGDDDEVDGDDVEEVDDFDSYDGESEEDDGSDVLDLDA